MAAGAEAASSGGRSSSSSAVLEATLDRRFQGVTNTMESIQSLSSWCLENKKHHGVVVRSWMKWLKKCELLWLALYTNTNRSSSLQRACVCFYCFFGVLKGLYCVFYSCKTQPVLRFCLCTFNYYFCTSVCNIFKRVHTRRAANMLSSWCLGYRPGL